MSRHRDKVVTASPPEALVQDHDSVMHVLQRHMNRGWSVCVGFLPHDSPDVKTVEVSDYPAFQLRLSSSQMNIIEDPT